MMLQEVVCRGAHVIDQNSAQSHSVAKVAKI